MSPNLKDILSHLTTDIDQETLLLYLQDKLPIDKKHEVEKNLLDNEFAGDALEGLQELKNKKDISNLIIQLNHDLKTKLEKKKKRKEQLTLKNQPWLYITIIILFLLLIISFIVIRRILLAD